MSNFFEEKEKNKSENFTIRIDNKTLNIIRSYAKSQKTTVNSVINELLSQSVEWDITAARAGWFPIPKEIIVNLFARIPEKELEEMGSQYGKKITRDMLLTMRGKVDVDDMISIISSRSKASNFHYYEIDESEFLNILIRHDMGSRFSKYLISFYDQSFKELECNAKFDSTENTFSIIIDKKFFNLSEKQESV